MGFWGTYIVARADQPLPELPALRHSAESVMWHGRGPGGWRAVRVHRGPEGWESAELPAPWEGTARPRRGTTRRQMGDRSRTPARRGSGRGCTGG
jgi:hypothetical protein